MKISYRASRQPEPSNHRGIAKNILFRGDQTSGLTQVATAVLKLGQTVESHHHPTMVEFFYVLSGTLLVVVQGAEHILDAGDCVQIDAGETHALRSSEESAMVLYWGLELRK